MLALICVACALATTSCGIGTKATRAQPPEAPPAPPPGLQANQQQPCPALPPARSDQLPELLANHDAVAKLYADCRTANSSLQAAFAEWQATAWAWYCKAVDRLGLDASQCRASSPK